MRLIDIEPGSAAEHATAERIAEIAFRCACRRLRRNDINPREFGIVTNTGDYAARIVRVTVRKLAEHGPKRAVRELSGMMLRPYLQASMSLARKSRN